MDVRGFLACVALSVSFAAPGEAFRVATFNLEGYLDAPVKGRPAKSAESKAKVRESIHALNPDVLALQEMGGPSALEELRSSLQREGLDFPFSEHVAGFDTNIHVAILSKFPFTARRPHTNDNFLLGGRRFRVTRGLAEVQVQVNRNYSFTLIAAHLKSKLAVARADEAELRLEEAKILREKIDARLAEDPDVNLVVLGDFNDTPNSASTKAIIGKGRQKLIDTRPAERNGDAACLGSSARAARRVTWTHFYAAEDSYARIDFLLLSAGMAREWITNETYVLAMPDWGLASDHRPIVAAFEAEER